MYRESFLGPSATMNGFLAGVVTVRLSRWRCRTCPTLLIFFLMVLIPFSQTSASSRRSLNLSSAYSNRNDASVPVTAPLSDKFFSVPLNLRSLMV